MSSPNTQQLKALQEALDNSKPPYQSGVLPVDAKRLVLFYGKDEAWRVDLVNASESDLERLAKACDPATFGRNHEDVLDDSYRKAGKLDETHFSTKLDVERDGFMEVIRYGLLEGMESQRPIRVELYKLNVYDKGCFFKAHKDTPRSAKMFGSLVIILPTKHDGGALVLRHDKKEWVFDSGKAIAEREGPCVAYATFYADVEHEVTAVKSGHRLTLTYNLYFEEDGLASLPPELTMPTHAMIFRTVLSDLLADPTFLPEGGYLGFGLRHQYPVAKTKDILVQLSGCLKGSDAMVKKTCEDLSLRGKLSLLYVRESGTALVDRVPEDGDYLEEGYATFLKECYDAKIIKSIYNDKIDFAVHWVTEASKLNETKTAIVVYGNNAEQDFAYGSVCLIVYIGPTNKRASDDLK